MKDILHDGSHSVKPSGCICFTKKIDCYVYYYIYYVCWYRYRICIAQLAVFTENRKEFLLLFVLGISIGSNSLIINNLGRFGWQAAILATLSILGSMLASFLVFHLFFKKGGKQ